MNMRYKSCYFEHGGAEGEQVLRESGFRDFPVVPRWGLSGGDIYGNSPGMESHW